MTIISTLPYNFTNGTVADATQVDANFAQILANVNANAATNGANVNITSLSGLSTPLSFAQGGNPILIANGSGTANNTTTYANISGLSFTTVSSAVYELIFHGDVACSGNGGIKIGTAGTTTFTSFSTSATYMSGNSQLSQTAGAYGNVSSPGTMFSISGGSLYYPLITGLLVVNAGGTLTIQMAEAAAMSDTTTLTNAVCKLTRIS